MHTFRSLSPNQIDPIFDRIGKEWMLITADSGKDVNTMTASWGGCGILWNHPVAFAFVRPQRHTFAVLEDTDHFTLAFFDERYRDALRYCGSHSGRDGDKFAASGLSPVRCKGFAYPAEASLVLICKKLYVQDMKEECFLDPSLLSHYEKKDFHRVYVGEILEALVNNE